MVMRILRNLLSGPWQVRRHFPRDALARIESAIAASESAHLGELRFVVEAGLNWDDLWHGVTARARAIEVFSQLRVWDTEYNSGVLIYLLLAERDVEIVADRGIHARVGTAVWENICREMEAEFRAGRFEQGVLTGIARISALLAEHFPAGRQPNANELPDAPIVI
ncbi:MAG: TPM domain-containing protein [Methylophilaceae bacterium]|nr:TPM domain-containing protein [Methylophilaceae bacterium]